MFEVGFHFQPLSTTKPKIKVAPVYLRHGYPAIRVHMTRVNVLPNKLSSGVEPQETLGYYYISWVFIHFKRLKNDCGWMNEKEVRL